MKKISSFATQNKKLSLAVIALLLAILIVSSATFSWIEGSKNGKVSDTASSVSAGDGLYFTDINGNMIKEIVFPKITLEDCTSKDGRNFFFPTTETKVGTSSDKMVYRAGTDADKNTKYISQDFNIVSYSVSDLYIDTRQSYINCTDSNEKVNEKVLQSLRLSLDFHDGSNPIVICPDNVTGYTRPYKPVTAIDSAGAATETDAEATALSDYSAAASRPVTSFGGDETKRITISMWLEGTDDSCTTDKIDSSQITAKIVFTNALNYTQQITFVDYTPSGWVDDVAQGGGNVKMFAVDKSTIKNNGILSGDRYEMIKQSDNITYTTKIPDDVTEVVFGRFDPDNSSLEYNAWAMDQTKGASNTYYAIGRGGTYDGKNYGYWVNSSCTGVITIEYTDTNYAISNSAKDYPYIYIWNSNLYGNGGTDKIFFKSWYGFQMDKLSGNNNNVYTFIIPAENGINFIINDKKGTDVSGYKRKTGYVSGKNQNQNYTMYISGTD